MASPVHRPPPSRSFSRGVYDTESNIDKRARASGADEEIVIEDSSLVILYKQDFAKRLRVEVKFVTYLVVAEILLVRLVDVVGVVAQVDVNVFFPVRGPLPVSPLWSEVPLSYVATLEGYEEKCVWAFLVPFSFASSLFSQASTVVCCPPRPFSSVEEQQCSSRPRLPA